MSGLVLHSVPIAAAGVSECRRRAPAALIWRGPAETAAAIATLILIVEDRTELRGIYREASRHSVTR